MELHCGTVTAIHGFEALLYFTPVPFSMICSRPPSGIYPYDVHLWWGSFLWFCIQVLRNKAGTAIWPINSLFLLHPPMSLGSHWEHIGFTNWGKIASFNVFGITGIMEDAIVCEPMCDPTVIPLESETATFGLTGRCDTAGSVTCSHLWLQLEAVLATTFWPDGGSLILYVTKRGERGREFKKNCRRHMWMVPCINELVSVHNDVMLVRRIDRNVVEALRSKQDLIKEA